MSIARFDADTVIDIRHCILGRVASEVAQRALDGETIAIIHAEDAVITGSTEDIMSVYTKRREIGSDQGPYYPRRPDAIVKRAIRGMLPYKTAKGKAALSSVRVYIGNPYDTAGEQVEDTSLDRVSTIKFMTIGDIAQKLGASVTW